MYNRFKQAIFIVVAVCLVLVTLEVTFRLMYSLKYRDFSYMTYGLKNVLRFNVEFFNGYMKLEEPLQKGEEIYCGFRTSPFSKEKPKGQYRIVALGGSSTYGCATADPKKTWSALLEKKLNNFRLKKELPEYEYRVINCGVGYQTTYGVNKLLTAEVLDFNPDLIIIYSLHNHVFFDNPAVYRGGPIADCLFRKLKAIFYRKSLLGTYLVHFIGLDSWLALQNKMETYRYLLTDMIKKCKQKDVDIIIVKQLINPDMFPKVRRDSSRRDCVALTTKYDSSQYIEFLEIIDEVGSEYKDDCTIVDFSAYSPTCVNRQDELLADVVHLTDTGRELLAELICGKI